MKRIKDLTQPDIAAIETQQRALSQPVGDWAYKDGNGNIFHLREVAQQKQFPRKYVGIRHADGQRVELLDSSLLYKGVRMIEIPFMEEKDKPKISICHGQH